MENGSHIGRCGLERPVLLAKIGKFLSLRFLQSEQFFFLCLQLFHGWNPPFIAFPEEGNGRGVFIQLVFMILPVFLLESGFQEILLYLLCGIVLAGIMNPLPAILS